MSDVPLTSRPVGTRPTEETLDRAFAAAYEVALAGSLAVSFLTYVYVGFGSIQEANPVTAAIIDAAGREGMVAVRTAVLVGGYRCYAAIRARTSWSWAVIACAWTGAAMQFVDLAVDLRVVVLARPPTPAEAAAGLAAVVPALVAGIVLAPPAEGRRADRRRDPPG